MIVYDRSDLPSTMGDAEEQEDFHSEKYMYLFGEACYCCDLTT